jgi:hypothetical protein
MPRNVNPGLIGKTQYIRNAIFMHLATAEASIHWQPGFLRPIITMDNISSVSLMSKDVATHREYMTREIISNCMHIFQRNTLNEFRRSDSLLAGVKRC